MPTASVAMRRPSRSLTLSKRRVVLGGHHPAHRRRSSARARAGRRVSRHVGVGLQNPVEAGDGAVEDALADVARHFLRPDQDALDLRVVDVGVVGAAGDAQVVAGADEQFLRGFLQAALGDAQAQPLRIRAHVSFCLLREFGSCSCAAAHSLRHFQCQPSPNSQISSGNSNAVAMPFNPIARPAKAPASSLSWNARAVPMPCAATPTAKPRTL